MSIGVLSCGDGNVFTELVPLPPEKEASRYLELKQPDKAISVLTKALGADVSETVSLSSSDTNIRVSSELESLDGALDGAALSSVLTSQLDSVYQSNSDVYKWASVLSSAYAQKLAMDPIDLALALVGDSDSEEEETSSSSSTESDSPIVALYSILPESTEANREQAQLVVSLLEAIPSALRTAADSLKISLFLTAQTSLITKELDTDPADGELTPNELGAESLTPAKAIEILNTLIAASENDAGGDSSSAEAAAAIDSVLTEIDSQEGESIDEKLRNYLGSDTSTTDTSSFK